FLLKRHEPYSLRLTTPLGMCQSIHFTHYRQPKPKVHPLMLSITHTHFTHSLAS
ncbi:hypothetical protein ACJX0J_029224, partial [Zea mays]